MQIALLDPEGHPLSALDATETASAPPLPAPAQALFDHWQSLPWGHRAPPKSAFDPLDLARVLPNVFLCTRDPGPPPGLRFGVHGTRVAEIVGCDLTAKRLDAVLEPARAARVAAAIEACLDAGVPVRQRLYSAFPGREHVPVERLVLPLEDAAGAIVHAVGALVRCAAADAGSLRGEPLAGAG